MAELRLAPEDIARLADALVQRLRPELVGAVEAATADNLLTVEAAAELAGCTPAALRKRIARGQVPTKRHGRTVLVRRGDLLGLGPSSEADSDAHRTRPGSEAGGKRYHLTSVSTSPILRP